MKKLLNQKEQHYADTREQAEEIVTAAKENQYLMMNKVTEKHNKFGTYFLVELTFSYDTPRDIMEFGTPQKNDAPDGQMSMGEVDPGVEYTVQGDGTVDGKSEGMPDF